MSTRSTTAAITVSAFVAMTWIGIAAHSSAEDGPVERVEVLRPPGFDGVDPSDADDAARIDGWLREQVALAGYPSLGVVIVRDGRIVYRGAFGFADLESSTRATPETSYHVASVTKVFTTTLAAVLDERGIVDLDAPVLKYLPEGVTIGTKPEWGARITLRQLASHTSGLPRGVERPLQSVRGRYELEPKRLYDQLATIEFEFEPGTDDRYSNLGTGLLGHALERAAGTSLERLAQREILAPVGAKHTSLGLAGNEMMVATGYGSSRPRQPVEHDYETRLIGSGGLVASAPDLARFLVAQMEPGPFSKEVLGELHTPTRLTDGSMIDHGLGWRLRRSEAIGTYASKNGGRANCSAWIGYSLEHDVGVAVVTNCGGPYVDPIGRWLLERSVPDVPTTALDREAVVERTYARVAPFTAVRWVNDEPEVRIDDEWFRSISIDGIPTSRITRFAEARFGERARMRFAEDLVEVLSSMGHDPEWTVTLELENGEGVAEKRRIRMTAENRNRVRERE